MNNIALAGYLKKQIQKYEGGCDLDSNKTATISANGTTVINPTSGKDGMEKATVTVAVPVPTLESNKAVTVDVSNYSTPVEITPSSNKDAMEKITLTLSNIPEVYDVVSNPTFSEESGTVESGTKIQLSCATEGATIFYTTNGDTPDLGDSIYSEEIEITETVTIKAIAFAKGKVNSSVSSATYTISE